MLGRDPETGELEFRALQGGASAARAAEFEGDVAREYYQARPAPRGAPPLPYKVDTSRPSLRTKCTTRQGPRRAAPRPAACAGGTAPLLGVVDVSAALAGCWAARVDAWPLTLGR